jgi:diguanylate cyclase (GGDEF)-like protein/PAS domain S-box-containing protein
VSESKDREERYRAVFENAAVGITRVDLDGVLIDVNQKFCDMLGYTRDELIGKAIRDITHSDDYGQGSLLRAQVTEGAIPSAVGEKRFSRKDGATVWARRTMSVVRGESGTPQYVISVVEDITDSKRTEEDRARLAAIVEFCQDAILSRDPNGTILSWNPAAERLFGFTAAEVIGQNISALIIPPEREQEAARTRALLEQGDILRDFRTERVTKDGRRIPVSLSQSPIKDAAGRVISVASIVRDITEQEYMEKCRAMEQSVTRVLADSVKVDEAVPKLIRIMCLAMDWDYGARWGWNEHEQRLRRAECWCEFEPEFDSADREYWFEAPVTSTGRMLSRVWRSKEPTWLINLHDDKPFRRRPSTLKFGWRSAYCFPITAETEVIGALEFFGRGSRQPDDMLLQVTASIGSQIGQFIARKQAEERVRHLAHYDELTGLANRNMFNQQLSHALAQSERHGRPLAILFIDLDGFKNVNDALGHEAGDQVLKEVAERLRGSLRESDTIARFGGDEFVVLVQEFPQLVHLAAVAQKILAEVAKPFILDAQEFHITASIGISAYPEDGKDTATLLKNADTSMYRAKERGKNTFQFYSA